MTENIDLFQRAAKQDDLFILFQDSRYFQWRILENPYPVKYRSFQLFDDKNMLQAQVICSVNGDSAFIEQVLFDRNLKMRFVHFLLKKAIRALNDEHIPLIRYIGFNNNVLNIIEMNALKKLGFFPTGKGEQVNFINLSKDHRTITENVYLSRLYKQGIN